MAEVSSGWTHTNPSVDFASTSWVTLEQQGESVYVEPVVAIAQDLTDPQQMDGARTDLEEAMAKAQDHVELLLSIVEQVEFHKSELDAWFTLNGFSD